MKHNIIVIAGTADARHIIHELAALELNITATVATWFGKELLSEHRGIDIRDGRLDAEEMKKLIGETSADCLVDASHPFAREVSVNAIKACSELNVPYIRFERQGLENDYGSVIIADDFEDAAKKASKYHGNIFLTIGSNNLDHFIKNIADFKERLFVRVLPDSRVLSRCEAVGLNPGNIIAIKGPFTEEMNIEMLKYTEADVIVMKDSGETGGTFEKISAARKLGIPVIMVRKPDIQYTNMVSTVDGVTSFVRKLLIRGR